MCTNNTKWSTGNTLSSGWSSCKDGETQWIDIELYSKDETVNEGDIEYSLEMTEVCTATEKPKNEKDKSQDVETNVTADYIEEIESDENTETGSEKWYWQGEWKC